MSERGDWLARAQVARADGGADALAAFERLDGELCRLAHEVGERLAGSSLSLAQSYALAAPGVAADLGARGFRAWAERGESLARGERANREAAVAYFRVVVGEIAALPPAELDRWLELVGRVSEASRRLGVAYLETTGRALAAIGESRAAKLEALAEAALRLVRSGWRGEFLAAAFLANGGPALETLEPAELDALVALGLAVQTGRDLDASLLGRLPDGLAGLEAGERWLVFATSRAAAERAPKIAATLYAELPGAIAALAPELRRLVLESSRAAAPDAEDLVRLLPWIPAIVRAVPEPARRPLLERLVALARRFPRTWIPAFRSLPRAVEVAGSDGIERWIERGERVAEESLDAGRAFFALESRTGLAALEEGSTAARFREVEGILRSYGRLLGEGRLTLREVAGASLRPALDAESLDGESFAVPSAISIFDSWEENFSVYKLMIANGVGRRLFGTFDLDLEDVRSRLPEATAQAFANGVGGRTLADLVDALGEDDPLLAVFVACDGARIDARLSRAFRGFAAELRSVASHLHRRARTAERPPTAELLLHLLGAGVPPRELAALSRDLDRALLETIAGVLLSPAASAADALAAAVLLRERLGDSIAIAGFGTQVNYDELFFEQMVEAGAERAAAEAEDDENTPPGAREIVDLPPEAVEQTDDEDAGGVPLSAEEIRKLLESGVILQVGRGTRMADGDGVFATGLDLVGAPAADDDELPAADPGGTIAVRRRAGTSSEVRAYEYDEWDHEIRDYRHRWCRLEEIPLGGDGGEFFERALSLHADLLPEVRRQFQRIRPERYRRIRGLEDGEDFDLNAVVEAKVDLRSRRAPSSRLYVARRREERDVATLFLVDMSASTDEALASEKGAARPSHPRRIIDVTKEALVVMAEALEEIGDQYAIYGFSGEGRKNVEVYRVKRFSEGLGATVRGRIGAIEPKRSTRMGTALRHAIAKMRGVASRSKHVLLLSDGFPQDFDYGSDRRSNVYGIQDTMMAIQECQAAGITPFCITVDKTGHDYLRLMCETSRYLVIEDVESLPLELPKIYERWVQG